MNADVDTGAPDVALAALAVDTRWRILVALSQNPASASALSRTLPVSRPAIIKHLRVLEAAGLVEPHQHGRELVYHAIGARLSALANDLDVIGRAWDDRLSDLKQRAERSERDLDPSDRS